MRVRIKASIFDNIHAGEAQPLTQLDQDTWAGAFSLDASLRAVGGACLGVDMVLDKQARAAFSAMRPPGHHAEPDKPMGFCLFSSAAIAAEHARKAWGLERVAVLDFDVHHGNGTQAAFGVNLIYTMRPRTKCLCFPAVERPLKRVNIITSSIIHYLKPDTGEALLAAWTETLLPRIAAAQPC